MLNRWLVLFLKGVVHANSPLLNVHLFVVAHLCVLSVELLNKLLLDSDLSIFSRLLSIFLYGKSKVYLALQTAYYISEGLFA